MSTLKTVTLVEEAKSHHLRLQPWIDMYTKTGGIKFMPTAHSNRTPAPLNHSLLKIQLPLANTHLLVILNIYSRFYILFLNLVKILFKFIFDFLIQYFLIFFKKSRVF